MESVDALFVLNQDARMKDVARVCRAGGHERIFILTTHRLFDAERRHIEQLIGSNVRASAFADWLDDAVMEQCDDRASAALLPQLGRDCVRRNYAVRFSALSLYFKNAAVCGALRRRFRWDSTYYAAGLGVSHRFWREQGAVRLPWPKPSRATPCLPAAALRVLAFLRFMSRTTRLHRIMDGRQEYLFTSVRRLPIAPGIRPEPIRLKPLQKLIAALRLRTMTPSRILLGAGGDDAVIATTIHDYSADLADGAPVRVFVDGFHPSNYPRTYLDQYGPATFVSYDPLSAGWFARFGRTVVSPPPFLLVAAVAPPSAAHRPKTVVLALNHAGDWTALINRSDTDILVEHFCDAARGFPELDFVVRPHPTMDHPAHEGRASRRRLEAYVRSLALPNLVVSDCTFDQDLERGDLFVSEYSQVLIDAIRRGKLAVIANFTGRRSFMVDYEAYGFASVADCRALTDFIGRACREPEQVAAGQAEAARRYNADLQRSCLQETADSGRAQAVAREASDR